MAGIVSCFTEPAKEALKWIGQQIIGQVTFLLCFTTNIKSLREEEQMLDNATKGLQLQVDNGRDKGHIFIDPAVEDWLKKSNDIKEKTSEILSEATNVESDHLKLGDRLSLSKRAKEMTDRAKVLRDQKKFDVIFHSGPPPARQAVEFGETFEFQSRREIEEAIMTALRGGAVNIIGIWGMGGLGKTTMAQKIRNRVLEDNVFDEVVIAIVSQKVNISKIQDEIGGQLGLEKLKEEKSQLVRKQMLQSRLSGTRRILLVLDDVWDRLALESIGIPRDSKGCTILFTSRNSDALDTMDALIFRMEVLSEEEAWLFFIERARICVDDGELNPIAKQVAKECGGLPLALDLVGVGLKDQHDAATWNNALHELKQCVPNTVRFDIKEVYNCLIWSYNRLNSNEAQSIFLLCCLFPEDANIPLEYLTYFSMGLGIFEGITNMEHARNRMWEWTGKLKNRCLLVQSDKKACVRMHDVLRDVCTFIAKEKGYISKDGCTWISSSHLVGQRNALLNGSRCPNLHLLFLDSTYDSSGFKFDGAFLEGMSELRVSCIERYSLTTLLHPTQSLAKLHTLILESCKELKSIFAVGKMVNLEILICRNCDWIMELPSEMKQLKSLKVLELSWCTMLQSIERDIISSLARLEELKMNWSFNRWEAEEREQRKNASIKELEALPNLACLEIDIRDPSVLTENMPLLSKKKIARFIIKKNSQHIPSRFSKGMSLCLERESHLGDWIQMQLVRDTEYLYLRGVGANNVELESCEGMKNISRTSGGDDATMFPSIEHLELESLPYLQEICDGPISSTSFQNLNVLDLSYLKALTQIWKSRSVCENNNNVPHFSKLSSIVIWNCDSLRNLGQLSMAGKDCLPQLEKLDISFCSMMEQVFVWNNTSIEPRHVIFPKLKEVELDDLPNLTTFYQGIQGIEFPLLMEMKIHKCPKMKSIIDGSNSADIDEDDSLLVLNKKVSFGSLEVLTIDIYGGSMSFFTLPVAANLRELSIRNCDEMIKVIEDKQQQQRNILLFPKLKILQLEDLPKLVSFCDWKSEVEFPVLEEVDIIRCPNMERFSLGLVATPNLEEFTTDLTTYVGVGVNAAFNSQKTLTIKENENPFDHQKISVSLFNGLKELQLYDFKGSVSLFPCSVVGSLVNLKVLGIGKCDEIVKVMEDDEEEKVVSGGEIRSVVFPKLEELGLDCLPNLVRFCEWKCDVEFPSLREVEIDECPNIESFSMGFVAAPNLEIVEIDDRKEVGGTKDLNGTLQQHYLARRE